jgi:hypothetical protein
MSGGQTYRKLVCIGSLLHLLNKKIQVGDSIEFTSMVSGTGNVELTWDFGDGSPTSSEVNPGHIFNRRGMIIVKLTAKNLYGTTVSSISIASDPFMTYLPFARSNQ